MSRPKKTTDDQTKLEAQAMETVTEQKVSTAIDTLEDYRRELDNAQIDGTPEWIEVTAKLFDRIKPGKATVDCFMAGEPGVMVHKEGTRSIFEMIQGMTAEDYAKYLHEERRANKRP